MKPESPTFRYLLSRHSDAGFAVNIPYETETLMSECPAPSVRTSVLLFCNIISDKNFILIPNSTKPIPNYFRYINMIKFNKTPYIHKQLTI